MGEQAIEFANSNGLYTFSLRVPGKSHDVPTSWQLLDVVIAVEFLQSNEPDFARGAIEIPGWQTCQIFNILRFQAQPKWYVVQHDHFVLEENIK